MITMGKSRPTPKSCCTACQHSLEMAAPIDADCGPSPGDISICIECGHLMAFAEDLTVRDLTDAEMVDVAGRQDILAAQRARGAVMGAKRR